MDTQTLFTLLMYILRAFLCCIFILLGMFVIAVTIPFDILWCSGFVLFGLGAGGVIIQMFVSYRETHLSKVLENYKGYE